MRKSTIYFSTFLALATFIVLQACSTGTGASEELVISGEVIEQSTGNTIADAIVEITSPSRLKQTTTTDSLGIFSFSIEADSSFSISVEASKQGFSPKVNSFKVAPGVDVTDLVLELASSGGGDGGDDGVGGEPAGAAAIVLVGVTHQAINIAETGDVVSSAFTFEVQDSAGRALNTEQAVDVNFSILTGPGGGEEITPSKARTNAQGKATSSLFSGNVAGPVKIQASVTRDDIGITIKSNPVLIAIHGGFPDLDHFSIAPDVSNMEGYNINGVRNTITVILGDEFGNPVKPGTVVYFTTSGGIIQGSGQTNEDGEVSADLISGDPRPNDTYPFSGGRPGYGTVTAKTIDKNDNVITEEIPVLFGGLPAKPQISPRTFSIPPNGGVSFSYTATDINGNPLPAGTQFEVEVGEGLDATGDVNFTLGDFLDIGPGSTEFQFSVTDTDETSSDEGSTSITLTVTTPEGKSNSDTITGTRAKTRGSN